MVLPLPAGAASAPRLLDQLRERIRYLRDSLRTEQACVHWVRAFSRFHGMRHPKGMGAAEVQAFMSWLSSEQRVSVSTQRQALSAVLFLYQQVFGQSLPWMAEIDRPQRKPRLLVVLTVDDVKRLLALMDGTHPVVTRLLYGTGLRITEALQLRVKDVEFDRQATIVRAGKGGKDRVVMLPAALALALQQQLERARLLWQADQRQGRGGVQPPDALDRKYPRACQSWPWFWVFPQDGHATCPRTPHRG